MFWEIVVLLLTLAWAAVSSFGVVRLLRFGGGGCSLGFNLGKIASGITGGVMGATLKPLLGAITGSDEAIKAQKDAANAAAAAQIYGQNAGANAALKEFAPWTDMENKARVSMGDILGYNGPDAAKSAMDALYSSPAFQFRLKTGQDAVDRSAAAGGGLFSGNTGKALMQYGQDLGSQEFDKEYNRRGGMMDWAYGNTANRANINRARYTGIGDITANNFVTQGGLNAASAQAPWNDLKDIVGTGTSILGSLYGASGPFGKAGGLKTVRNPYGD